jgi:polyphosphate kinase
MAPITSTVAATGADTRTPPSDHPRPALGLHDPRLFINRELSWLEFDARVLEEARSARLPILERLKFHSIFASNLDEFFMVRVAGLKQQILGGVTDAAADGLLPSEQLAAVSARVHDLVAVYDAVWRDGLLPGLAAAGLHLVPPREMTPEQRQHARGHFVEHVFPALTPLAVDPGHPFPHLRNKSLNLAVRLRRGGRRRRRTRDHLVAVVQVPAVLPRVVRLPSASQGAFALLEEIIGEHARDLFPGYAVTETALFRVTRNWDLSYDEEESEDLLSTIQAELRRRDRGAAVRLEISAAATAELERELAGALELEAADVYRVGAPLQAGDLLTLGDGDPRPELRIEPFTPAVPPSLQDGERVASVVAKADVLLHHPYESLDPVVRFIEEAAEDPAVLAIKQTLYRTSGDSPFVRALSRAADNGKQVTVLVEIKARFDEANNIAWARRLEDAGVHVVYGLIGLKTHCKVALVVRRERDGIRRYVHLGTGNYNPQTARQYTDLSLLSAREELADDVSALFNMLTGYAEPPPWKRLAVAPFGLGERLIALIGREEERARAGRGGRIVAKVNSLVDPAVIRALYAASSAGVEIDLLVRSICCLRPGVPGVSDRIRVTSVVGRFLEHARVFVFGTGHDAECYLSSADWMPRNLHRRVEVMLPVDDAAQRARILEEVVDPQLREGARAWRLQANGTYLRVPADGGGFDTQQALLDGAGRSAPSRLRAPVAWAAPPR